MARRRLDATKILNEKKTIQQEIGAKFSKEVIREVRQRLCANCSVSYCSLLPICLDGSDCPYFKLAVQLPLPK